MAETPDTELPEELATALNDAFSAAGMEVPEMDEEGNPSWSWDVEMISVGTVSMFYKLTHNQGTFFVKWAERAEPDKFLRERESLDTLTARGTILQIPKIIAPPLEATFNSKVLVMELMKPSPTGTGRSAWQALGRGLAELHRRYSGSYGFTTDNYCGTTVQENAWHDDWAEFFATRRLGAIVTRLEQSRRMLDRETAVFRALIERLPSLLPHKPMPSLCHGELWMENYMDSVEGPALFDPACFYGDREMDLCCLPLKGGFPEDVLNAYMEVWPLPHGWKERFPIYQLYHILNHAILYGGQYGEDALKIAKGYL